MESEGFPRAEEALRLLAAAAGAARLYPPASTLPRQAAERFVARSHDLTEAGPLRYVVDPHGIRIGDAELAATQGQVTALAEALHALQVGQLVIAPGVSVAEAEAFVALANSDPAQVRAGGGPRVALARLGVRHIAVIEISLRTCDESGLIGVDLTTAPLDEIATEVAAAVERRRVEASSGTAHDEVAEAIGRLEDATRELAMERVAGALMRLDEATRTRVLSIALAADANGTRMDGMLAVIARMKPAALARLLMLVAAQSDTDPRRVAGALELPPETAKALALMLTPAPDLAPDFGDVPDTEVAAAIAEEVSRPAERSEIEQHVREAAPASNAGRALATATAVSRTRVDAETVHAIGEVLPLAARDGAFPTVREALRRLDELAADPALAEAVTAARATLAMPEVLRDVCRAAESDADAAIAGEILHAAGVAGAEALLDTYIRLDGAHRSLLQPVLRSSSELVLGVARSRLRSVSAPEAVAIIRALAVLGDRRAAAVIAGALETSLEEQVRFAAASALASMPVPEAANALTRALGHREVETQRYIVRELGRIRAAGAVPALCRLFDDMTVVAKSYEIRKEIIVALGAIDTPEARKALRKFSGRLGFGRKSRELKRLANDAIAVTVPQGVDAP